MTILDKSKARIVKTIIPQAIIVVISIFSLLGIFINICTTLFFGLEENYTSTQKNNVESQITIETEIIENTKLKISETESLIREDLAESAKNDAEVIKNTEETINEAQEIIQLKTNSTEDLFIKEGSGYYNYAASVLVNDKINTFYCSNKNSKEIIDYICYRESSLTEDNTYEYSEEKIVLSPTPGTWDEVHVCDPSVIQGNFNYNGTNYCYLMAYLGCNTTNNQENKIGLAVSNSLDSGWIKINANPIITIPYDTAHTDAFQWGVGQPSILSIDGNGNVLICYTQGKWNLTSQVASVWNLSDLNNPVCLGSTTISSNGTNDFISNADFAYSNGTLFLICDKHPFSAGTLNNVSDTSAIYSASISSLSDLNAISNCTWTSVATIGNYDKNHNSAFFRDGYGNLYSRNVLTTKAEQLSTFTDSLWTYRLKNVEF